MNIDVAFLLFPLVAIAIFRVCPPVVATLIIFLGGWVVLPVGYFPSGSADAEFPYWITGLAVPSDMLVTKAWVAPASALLGALLFDRQTVLRFRPHGMDAPMVLWCLWPLLQSLFVDEARPMGVMASLYLTGCWGLPWLLGRLYFCTPEGQILLLKGLAVSALACLPFSLIEGVFGPKFYEVAYELHPFRFDGIERYIGFRPIGFFENGNQFGLWISLCALAAVWLAWTTARGRELRPYRVAAGIVVAMAVAAQSAGGLLIFGIGAAFLWVCRLMRPRLMVATALGALILGGAVYVSGVVPITKIGKETALGQRIVDGFRAVGRGSFAWRISQDQKLLPDAMAKPLAGWATWDWWRSKAVRPWSLTILMLGQFGLVGLCLCLGSLLAPALRVAWQAPQASGWRPQALPLLLATLVVLTVFDALMNSFIFFPAIAVAGGLVGAPAVLRRPRGEVTRIPSRRAA